MRILALYQFYLPFPLPRNGDWESATLTDKEADAVIELAPMRRKEALFPRPVDQALKAMVVFAGVPGSGWPTGQRTIADSCIDRVRIEVSFDGVEKDARDPKVQHRIWKLAAERLDRFLRHCRAAARDWNIFGLPRDGTGEVMLLGQFPHSVAWFDAKDGTPLFGGKNSEEMHGHLAFSPARSVAFTLIAKNIASGQEPSPVTRRRRTPQRL